MHFAVSVGVAQAGLLAMCAGQPSQEVVEASILHHHDDNVVDARGLSGRQWLLSRGVLRCACESSGGSGTDDVAQETPSIDGHACLRGSSTGAEGGPRFDAAVG